ncbi:helix-turn-helix domain-containing protein [Streptomyces bobili]|uniref:helix-turn-helix domain-containing protein n=1 Tax=Streptomyces bobili TaxID=67280 RepID=UPI003405D952
MTTVASPPDADRLVASVRTTDSLPIRPRRTYWREALSQTFAAADVAVPDKVCSGTIRTFPLGHLQLTTAEGGPMRVRLTPRLIAQGDNAYVVIGLMERGGARIEQDGREVYLRPGAFTFCDMARPIHIEFPDPYKVKTLALPRQNLGLSDSVLRQISASPLRSDMALGGLLSILLSRLADTAGTLRPRTGEFLARNVVDLLTVLADEQLGRVFEETPSGDAVLLLRIRTFISRHLADPDLTPEVIAQAHHISVRYLHKIFEVEDTTVSRWIQSRRLEACRRELLHRAAANRTIAAVAHRWGFTSAAHFSRVFRAAYGMSPSEWRDAHRL